MKSSQKNSGQKNGGGNWYNSRRDLVEAVAGRIGEELGGVWKEEGEVWRQVVSEGGQVIENPSRVLGEWGIYDFVEGGVEVGLFELARKMGLIGGGRGDKELFGGVDVEDLGGEGEGIVEVQVGEGAEGSQGNREVGEKEKEWKKYFEDRWFGDKKWLGEVWKREFWIMWKYFGVTRGLEGVMNQKDMIRVLRELRARVVVWGKEGDKKYEIRIPMMRKEGSGKGEREVLDQVYRIEIKKEEDGSWVKVKKRLKFKSEGYRSIRIGVSELAGVGGLGVIGGRWVIVEGIEDALTLRGMERLRVEENGGNVTGGIVEIHVVGGTSGYQDGYYRCQDFDDDGMPLRLVDVWLDNDTKGGSIKASMKLGWGVDRVMPVVEGEDINGVLMEKGVGGVLDWMGENGGVRNIGWQEAVEIVEGKSEKGQKNKVVEGVIEGVSGVGGLGGECGESIVIGGLGGGGYDVEGGYIPPLDSDHGVALLFKEIYGKEFLIAQESEEVWRWNSGEGVWEPGAEREIYGLIVHLCARMIEEARVRWEEFKREEEEAGREAVWKGSEGQKIMNFVRSMGSDSKQTSIEKSIKKHGVELVSVKEFDANPDIFNCRNGVLDLRTLEFHEHDGKFMCTRRGEVDWIWGSRGVGEEGRTLVEKESAEGSGKFQRFVKEIMCEEQALVEYKWKQFGYLLGGRTHHKALFYHFGESGDNGKSTEASILRKIMGSYAQTFSDSLIAQEQYGSNNETLWQMNKLPGVRLAIMGEIDESKKWDEKTVKAITSGGEDEINARFMRGEYFRFYPVCKLMIHANNKPKVTAGDKAFWRRLHMVPYEYSVPEGKKNPNLVHEIMEEKNHIFGLMAINYERMVRGELEKTVSMSQMAGDYEDESNYFISLFIKDCLVIDGSAECDFKEIFDEYLKFCKDKRVGAKSMTYLGRVFTNMGIGKSKRNSLTFRTGVRLKTFEDDNDFEDIVNPEDDDDDDEGGSFH